MKANRFSQVVDANTILKDAGALTASAACQVGGSARVIDTGASIGPSAGMGDGPLTPGTIVIDVTAMDITSTNEIYDIVLQGSPDAAFGTAGNIVELATLSLGAKGPKRTDCDKDDVIGRYLLPFVNWYAGTHYRYLRLYVAIGGTTPSINFTAFMGKDL